MNYVQVNIGGQLRGLKFNELAYTEFYSKVDLNNYVGTFNYAAVWSGLMSNAYVKREEFTVTFETVCEWVDEMSREDKLKVQTTFVDTAYFKQAVKDGEAVQPAKKKKSVNTTKAA